MSESTPATRYINQPIYQPDFRAQRDNVGKWTGSETFTVKREDTTDYIPDVGDGCTFPGFEFLTANEVEISNIEGDLVEIRTTYAGFDPNFVFDENNADEYNYELSIQVSEEPLITNPRFQFPSLFGEDALSQCEKILIRDYLAGLLKVKEPDNCSTPYDPDADITLLRVSDESVVTPDITSSTGKLFFQLSLQGIESYYASRQIWRITYTDTERPSGSELNAVGKIVDDPIGAPAVANNRNWLLNGINVTTSRKNVFTITKEYILSDIGGWDEELYRFE